MNYKRHARVDAILYSSDFTKNIFARHHSKRHSSKNNDRQLIIRILCPRIKKSQSLLIAGNCDELGNWNPLHAKAMCRKNLLTWEIRLDIHKIAIPFEYKFIIADEKREYCLWEYGENRLLSGLPEEEYSNFYISTYPFRNPNPQWKGAGTVIPVFALRSEQSFGIGDFHDLKLLIDWAKRTDQCIIQVLPINDTCSIDWNETYPYNAISIYAINPIYISLSDLGALKNEKKNFIYRTRQKKLNREHSVWYYFVLKHKLQYCRSYFEQEEKNILDNKDFQLFCQDNRSWLEPYALFCFYRDRYHTSDFTKWAQEYNPQIIQKIFDKSILAKRKMIFTCFLQFVLHKQLKAVANYARKQGIMLKGDLPIGVCRTSVESWVESSYFNCDMQAGAPPDLFSDTGQVWPFPTYNWPAMEKDGYEWWKKRFCKISDYFDAIRIDHILGFFRIWEIPLDDIQGLCGHFKPALPLAVEEIEKAGFPFDIRFAKPRIHRMFLIDIFGDLAEMVTEKYLTPDDDNYMVLKPFCDTQQKINHLLSRSVFINDDKNARIIWDGLLKITNEVLFVEDPYEMRKFHPRILASQTYAFQRLAKEEQVAWQNLANIFFYERHNEYWKAEALKRLTPLVHCTDMLICGEDLGMIPKSVPEVMNKLHILSLELERTPKTSDTVFTNLQTVPYLSVSTTSTHDMEPLREWWKLDKQKTQQYFQSVLRKTRGSAPDSCNSALAEQIIMNHLMASSMLTIIPLQDWLALSDQLKRKSTESERINIPDDPKHIWRYRMHISLEQLLQANDLNQKISELIEKSGR